MNKPLTRRLQPRPRGISLVAVLGIVAVGGMAILGAFRMAVTAESVTGGQADYSRTFAAAEATLRDAEHDVRGRLPDATNPADVWTMNADGGLGLPCQTGAAGAGLVFLGCRKVDVLPGSSQNYLWIPRNAQDYAANYMIAATVSPATRCRQGICVPDSMAALKDLHKPPLLAQVFPDGAHYGKYTGAAATSSNGNPSLSQNTGATALPADGQPWSRYWIEVFIYAQSATVGGSAAGDLVPDAVAPYVYRITAIAQGRKPGTRVVLREVFVPNPLSQNP